MSNPLLQRISDLHEAGLLDFQIAEKLESEGCTLEHLVQLLRVYYLEYDPSDPPDC
jgi:hypothetical protein